MICVKRAVITTAFAAAGALVMVGRTARASLQAISRLTDFDQ